MVRLDNVKGDASAEGTQAATTPEMASPNATMIRTVDEVIQFVRGQSLLPLSAVTRSIAIHELFHRGWEGEPPAAMSMKPIEAYVPGVAPAKKAKSDLPSLSAWIVLMMLAIHIVPLNFMLL